MAGWAAEAADWCAARGGVRSLAFLDQGIVSGGNFVAGILMARAFGAYQFGWFTLAWLVVEFMSSLQFAAILQPMLNVGPKEEPDGSTRYYTAVAVQQLVIAMGLAMLVWGSLRLAGELFDGPFNRLALPLAITTAIYQAQNFFRRYLFCRGRPMAALLNDILRFGVQLTALLALVASGDEEPGAEIGIWIVAGACLASSLQGALSFGPLEFDRATFYRVLKHHWSFSRWLLPSAVMYWMTSQSFLLMSGAVLGPAMTGSLKVAMSITGVLNIMLQSLDGFAPIQAARALQHGGRDELLRYMIRLAALTAGLMGLAATLLSIDPQGLIRLVYGSEYSEVGYLVRWMCAAGVVYSVVLLLGIWAAAIERTSLIFRSYVFASIFTIVASYPLTFYYGLDGVVAGILLVEIIKVAALIGPLRRWIK